MAHYAYVDENNRVVDVITGRDESDTVDGVSDWETYYAAQREGFRVLRTSYNTRAGEHLTGGTPFRGNYAGIGFTYDETLDAFIPPKPSEDATLDPETFSWVVPETDEA
jgi:hypothetical protein